MRHEFTETAATRLEWALPLALAVVVAAVLLIASPGKRFELWAAAIVAGLALGAIIGTLLKVNTRLRTPADTCFSQLGVA